jgi:very-short-patch-repair endonuclease
MDRMRPQSAIRAVDRAIAAIARHQHGVITFEQLLGCGLSARGISHRCARGRLRRIHRGVYAVGDAPLTQDGVWPAAVKACGQGAVLSHQSAAQLSKLLPLPDSSGPVHVTVAGTSGRRSRPGIHVHRSTSLTRAEWMIRDAIPLTSPARTLTDLRRVLPHERWEDALDRARVLSLPIGGLSSTEPTRSRFERRLLALCRRHQLPRPEVNARVAPFLLDFLWRNERLVVEADSWEHHRDRAAFEADRARDAELRLRGYTVVRFTWRQLANEPGWVVGTIRGLLGA